MNLGQVLGQAYLRIAELEEQLEAQPTSRRGPLPRGPRYRGVLDAIRSALAASEHPMTIDELASVIQDVPRSIIAKNIQVSTCNGAFVREGARASARYRLP